MSGGKSIGTARRPLRLRSIGCRFPVNRRFRGRAQGSGGTRLVADSRTICRAPVFSISYVSKCSALPLAAKRERMSPSQAQAGGKARVRQGQDDGRLGVRRRFRAGIVVAGPPQRLDLTGRNRLDGQGVTRRAAICKACGPKLRTTTARLLRGGIGERGQAQRQRPGELCPSHGVQLDRRRRPIAEGHIPGLVVGGQAGGNILRPASRRRAMKRSIVQAIDGPRQRPGPRSASATEKCTTSRSMGVAVAGVQECDSSLPGFPGHHGTPGGCRPHRPARGGSARAAAPRWRRCRAAARRPGVTAQVELRRREFFDVHAPRCLPATRPAADPLRGGPAARRPGASPRSPPVTCSSMGPPAKVDQRAGRKRRDEAQRHHVVNGQLDALIAAETCIESMRGD